jgi:hypothetical protein
MVELIGFLFAAAALYVVVFLVVIALLVAQD